MNQTMIQFFHWYSDGEGVLWKQAKKEAKHLSNLGITSVWFPPAYKGTNGGYSVGYDAYDLYDLGEFDQKNSTKTKYGSKDEYINCIKALKKEKIQVIVDIVLGHKAGGDELETFKAAKVDENNREKIISEFSDIQSYTKFTFPGRGKKYSNFEWNFTCFSGVDYAEGKDSHIYKIQSEYGNDWEEMIDDEKGNYDYLMFNDVEHRNPHVREELNTWAQWYFEQTDFDGVRLDALKHISYDFYKEWLTMLRSNSGKNIFAVGEYWAPGQLNLLQKYIDATEGCMSLFDSSLHNNFHTASNEGDSYDLRRIFDETLTEADPLHSVSIVDNHDTQPLQDLEAPVEKWFKPLAYALILLREKGYPCVFYPDLYGAHYKDNDREGNEQEIFLDKVDGIEEMLIARKDNAYGLQRDYFEDANCLGWTREGDEEHEGCAVTLSNKEAYNKPMEVGKRYAGKRFADALKRFEEKVTIDENGWGNFPVPAGNVSVWIPE
ncbi:Cytoplasmic alpha-amylase [Chryseobacterium aquaeductus]|uniref:Cytoplasmic alpha-amylase n=1 Tax=Chryseobacterium aquaeductus TaxID=2675056 RepID=A0A9N8QSR3_9FLAO|nr:alpha-amylase [Chryseobacterium aquaeductus]CAA7331334.1 Cytoplasmic alpha-amylase [Chryseobacterium potabilaquae]CAD7809582.1 Cytoplasmic alpha-amylase [Chryseobacterium aquaeductus]